MEDEEPDEDDEPRRLLKDDAAALRVLRLVRDLVRGPEEEVGVVW